MTLTAREQSQLAVAVTTAILNGDFATSSRLIEDLELIDIHGLIGGIVGVIAVMASELASATGTDQAELTGFILQKIGGLIA